jgi:hypothetical protein
MPVEIDEFERGNTIKSSIVFQFGGADTDPTSPVINVYKPDGTLLVTDGAGVQDATGQYHYYFSTASTDPLGLYKVVWSGTYTVDAEAKPVLDSKLIMIVDTNQ